MSTTSITDLLPELWELICAKLAISDVFRTETTCKKWKRLIWSSRTDIIFPICNIQQKRWKAVSSAIHKILTAADPIKIRRLDLSTISYKLNEQDIAALKNMRSLNYLSINIIDMTQESCSFIPYLTNLQHLSLSTKPIQECIDSVGSAHLPHLTSLAIMASPLPYYLSSLQNLTRVKALDLRGCQLLDNTSIIALFTSMTQLDTLNIARVRGIESEAVFGSLSCLTNLTDLSLSRGPASSMYNNWNGEALLNKVLSTLSTLKSLDVSDLRNYNDETVAIISNMSDLTRLEIFFDELPSEALSKLTTIQCLNLSSMKKRKSDKFYSVMTNLTSLTIQMTDSDFSHFDHLTRLKCLTIGSTIEKHFIGGSFYPYVQKMTQLEHLDFRCSSFAAVQLKYFSLQLLTHLNIKNIWWQNAAAVINPLTRLTNLRSLHTPACGWNVDWLPKLSSLEQLEIFFPTKTIVWNPMTVLTPLLGMTKLFRLSMHDISCVAEDVRELFGHRHLTSLSVNSNYA